MDERLFFRATQRNRIDIRNVLNRFLSHDLNVLELASGSGEHAVYFQKKFPNIHWQTSDISRKHIRSIASWIKHENLSGKMPLPIYLNVNDKPWNLEQCIYTKFDLVVAINLLHVSPFSISESLFSNLNSCLSSDGLFYLYGPFKRNGFYLGGNDHDFDKSLQLTNPDWGLRDIKDIDNVAKRNGFRSLEKVEMPANNLSLFYSINKF